MKYRSSIKRNGHPLGWILSKKQKVTSGGEAMEKHHLVIEIVN